MRKFLTHKLFILFLCLLAPAMYFGCAALDDAGSPLAENNLDLDSDSGRQMLIEHRVSDAHLYYKGEHEKNPNSGYNAAGYALTNLLLLPYDPSVTKLIERLGGKGALNRNRDVIYGTNGFISLLEQGTPFEDEGSFSGINSLLGPDLPWTAEELHALNFLDTINVDLQLVAEDLVSISESLIPIAEALEVGLNDESFTLFELPGEVFFNEHLTLSINRADLAFAASALRGVRALTLFVAAYEHPYKVSDFGSQWDEIGPNHEANKEGYAPSDYLLEFLDPKIFRKIAKPNYFAESSREFKKGLQIIQKALEIAHVEGRFGALGWNRADKATIENGITFLKAIESAIDNSTKLPFVEPSLSLDLSIIFRDGRTLDSQIPWFVFTTDIEDPSFVNVDLNEDAQEPLLDGLFTPRLEDLENGEFSEAEAFSDLAGDLFGTINDDFNSSFGN